MANRIRIPNTMHSLVVLLGLLALLVTGAPRAARASAIMDVLALTDRILVVHFNDGHVVYHTDGQPYTDDQVIVSPLDTTAASQASAYRISSADDPAFATAQRPASVGLKTKGTAFSTNPTWDLANNRYVISSQDHIEDHWLYLTLPQPLQHGKTYAIATGSLATNGTQWNLTYDERTARSEAVHVNLLGYVPSAPQKFAYVFHWMGDQGGLDLASYAGHSFQLVDQQTSATAFNGTLVFRKSKTNVETYASNPSNSTPNGNYLGADVYECDFSPFTTPGTYVVAVDGVGCSFPFQIGNDVYRQAFHTTMKGIYHQRSGIALTAPYTDFPRPAPHNPALTPGFAGKLIYTSVRFTEWGSEGGNATALLAGSKGPLDSWGWYQDAGDWDSYYSHPAIAQQLLFAYELAPRNFTDGELNIPESGNGVPDILDEAAWLPRFCLRLRTELLAKSYGTGGIGLRIAGDAFGSDLAANGALQGSWQDVNRTWAASGEDPWSTYRYAGVAAHLAYCLNLAGVADPEGADWEAEARAAYTWAQANTLSGDSQKLSGDLAMQRAYAAAALFRLTGEAAYETQFKTDTAAITATTWLVGNQLYYTWLYALGGGKAQPDPATYARIRAAVLYTADQTVLSSVAMRALRWGGNAYVPMGIGQQTSPVVLEAAVGYVLAHTQDPAKANQYLAALYTTSDYFLGGNSLNMTWATGLGVRHPDQVFSLDAWSHGQLPHPGVIPYGPVSKGSDNPSPGPYDSDWPNPTLHPAIDQWPGNERWFGNRNAPISAEYTTAQTMAPSAAIFGILCAPGLTGPGPGPSRPAAAVLILSSSQRR